MKLRRPTGACHFLACRAIQEKPRGQNQQKRHASAWPAASASFVFTATTVYLSYLYTYLHWRVVFSPERYDSQLTEGLKSALLVVLGRLEYYRVFAVLALLWGLWALRGRPRWAGHTPPATDFLVFLDEAASAGPTRDTP